MSWIDWFNPDFWSDPDGYVVRGQPAASQPAGTFASVNPWMPGYVRGQIGNAIDAGVNVIRTVADDDVRPWIAHVLEETKKRSRSVRDSAYQAERDLSPRILFPDEEVHRTNRGYSRMFYRRKGGYTRRRVGFRRFGRRRYRPGTRRYW